MNISTHLTFIYRFLDDMIDFVIPSTVHPEAVLAEGFKLADESTFTILASMVTADAAVVKTGAPDEVGVTLESAMRPVKSSPSGVRRMASARWKSNAALWKNYLNQ